MRIGAAGDGCVRSKQLSKKGREIPGLFLSGLGGIVTLTWLVMGADLR